MSNIGSFPSCCSMCAGHIVDPTPRKPPERITLGESVDLEMDSEYIHFQGAYDGVSLPLTALPALKVWIDEALDYLTLKEMK